MIDITDTATANAVEVERLRAQIDALAGALSRVLLKDDLDKDDQPLIDYETLRKKLESSTLAKLEAENSNLRAEVERLKPLLFLAGEALGEMIWGGTRRWSRRNIEKLIDEIREATK